MKLLVMAALLTAGTAAATSPSSTPAAGDRRPADVRFRITSGDRLVGTPTIALREGEPASISVRRPGGYALDATLSRVMVSGHARAQVATRVALEEGGSWIVAASPVVTLPFGNTATVRVTRGNGKPPFELSVAIAPAN